LCHRRAVTFAVANATLCYGVTTLNTLEQTKRRFVQANVKEDDDKSACFSTVHVPAAGAMRIRSTHMRTTTCAEQFGSTLSTRNDGSKRSAETQT
jgi:hypothetical protein